ncbi:ClpP family protease [Leucobacter albus]|uniref:ATP-dependent Clp protease proteolytic subunit n=1 Tax=Leucobacter albus TaxID=272210 RepID=A0ABW3TIP8_9MICO
MSDSPKPPVFTEPYRRELFDRRTLVLDGELNDDNGLLLATQLHALAAADAESEISLWIHSPGGSVPAMLAIRDLIRLVPNDVATLALGVAASAGQFLLTAGTPGKRRALPHARVLMHQGSAGIGGSTVDVELQAAHLRHTRDTVLGLTSHDTGQPLERVFEDSLHDHWFTATEAVAYGFVDRVVTDFGEIAPPGTATRIGTGFAPAHTDTTAAPAAPAPEGTR